MTRAAALIGTILIADDNRVNRLLLGRGLEQQGHTVVFAEHGREALDLLRNNHFDLMLLDVLMPELDDYEVLAELNRDPVLRDIPVIMTSSLDEPRQRCEVRRDGSRGLSQQADQPSAAQRTGQREPREEAAARSAAQADQQVREEGSGGRSADVGLLARRKAARCVRAATHAKAACPPRNPCLACGTVFRSSVSLRCSGSSGLCKTARLPGSPGHSLRQSVRCNRSEVTSLQTWECGVAPLGGGSCLGLANEYRNNERDSSCEQREIARQQE
jgi:CheY-like chemotaxis protein